MRRGMRRSMRRGMRRSMRRGTRRAALGVAGLLSGEIPKPSNTSCLCLNPSLSEQECQRHISSPSHLSKEFYTSTVHEQVLLRTRKNSSLRACFGNSRSNTPSEPIPFFVVWHLSALEFYCGSPWMAGAAGWSLLSSMDPSGFCSYTWASWTFGSSRQTPSTPGDPGIHPPPFTRLVGNQRATVPYDQRLVASDTARSRVRAGGREVRTPTRPSGKKHI